MKINSGNNITSNAKVIATTSNLRPYHIDDKVFGKDERIINGVYKPECLHNRADILPGEFGFLCWDETSKAVQLKDLEHCYFDNPRSKSYKYDKVYCSLGDTEIPFPKVFKELLAVLERHPDYTLCTAHRPSYSVPSAFQPVQFGKRKKDAYFSTDKEGHVKYKNRSVFLVKKPTTENDIVAIGNEVYWYPSYETIQRRTSINNSDTKIIDLKFAIVSDAPEVVEKYYANVVAIDDSTLKTLKKQMSHLIKQLAEKQEQFRQYQNKSNLNKEIFNEVRCDSN